MEPGHKAPCRGPEVLDERLEVVGAAVAVVDVVGVLPHVDAEDRGRAVDQRVLAVRGLQDGELAVLDREPGPAGAELADTGLDEVGLELLVAAEILVDLLGQRRRGLTAAVGLHPVPEVEVVVVLAGVVEERLIGVVARLDDLLDALAGEVGGFEQLVAGVDIGLVVLVVVKLEGFLRHVGPQRVVGVGQLGQSERHACLLGCPGLAGSGGEARKE